MTARAQPVLATVLVVVTVPLGSDGLAWVLMLAPGLGDAAVVAEARPRAGRSGDSRVRADQRGPLSAVSSTTVFAVVGHCQRL